MELVRIRIDCTDMNGHMLETKTFSGENRKELQQAIQEYRDKLLQNHGRDVYIFHNTMAARHSQQEPRR